MSYTDGFVIPIPKRNVAAYRAMARKASVIWKEYGALEYFECVGDDIGAKPGMGTAFSKMAKLKPGETVMFSWVVWKSRAHRDRANAKIMKDPRLAKMMDPKKKPPFDMKRFAFGGFKVIVQA